MLFRVLMIHVFSSAFAQGTFFSPPHVVHAGALGEERAAWCKTVSGSEGTLPLPTAESEE